MSEVEIGPGESLPSAIASYSHSSREKTARSRYVNSSCLLVWSDNGIASCLICVCVSLQPNRSVT